MAGLPGERRPNSSAPQPGSQQSQAPRPGAFAPPDPNMRNIQYGGYSSPFERFHAMQRGEPAVRPELIAAMNPQQQAAYSASQAPASPFADMPKYDVFGADGRLKQQYYQDPTKYNTGGKAINALEQRAFAKGPSAWLNMQYKGLDQQTANARDQAGRDANYALGSGMSNLAASGGIDSGARERLASQSSLGRMNAMQGVSRDANMQRTSLGMEDERQKLAIMQSLPGMRMQQSAFTAGIDQANINRDFGAFTNNYNEQMKAWAANKTGNAISKGGGSQAPGGILNPANW